MSVFRVRLFVPLLCLGVLILTSCSREMSMPRFSKLHSFQGRVTKVEEIPHEPDYVLHSASGSDFRITVVRADGSTIVIKRIHTSIGRDRELKELVQRQTCALPDEVASCEDRIGKDRY